jgi:predicted CoA-substrate-specific enzyme activase
MRIETNEPQQRLTERMLQESNSLHRRPMPSATEDVFQRCQAETLCAGIDVGSRTTKAVMLKGHQIRSSAVMDTGVNPRQTAEKTLAQAAQRIGIARQQIQCVVGTGYGRVCLSFVDRTVTELTCHAKGCHFLNPQVRTVIDIGGQDSKVIRLNDHGDMVDFVMNDKCAAGTGKFLEMSARTLELSLEEMAGVASDPTQACAINSMCVVFAETEIISLLAKRKAPQAIVAGINRAFAMRIGNMAKRLGLRLETVFVGGVAKNAGLAKALTDYLGSPFAALPIDPQLTGALGAAVLAQQSIAHQGGRTCP